MGTLAHDQFGDTETLAFRLSDHQLGRDYPDHYGHQCDPCAPAYRQLYGRVDLRVGALMIVISLVFCVGIGTMDAGELS